MLITTLRFYERILLGLYDPDDEIKEVALSCLSYLVFNMKQITLDLPPPMAKLCRLLPAGSVP